MKKAVLLEGIKDEINNTILKETLTAIVTNKTAAMTRPYNGAIRCFDECLDRPLQWSVCLLHTNKLPFKHVFSILKKKIKGPDLFSGSIEKQL